MWVLNNTDQLTDTRWVLESLQTEKLRVVIDVEIYPVNFGAVLY